MSRLNHTMPERERECAAARFFIKCLLILMFLAILVLGVLFNHHINNLRTPNAPGWTKWL